MRHKQALKVRFTTQTQRAPEFLLTVKLVVLQRHMAELITLLPNKKYSLCISILLTATCFDPRGLACLLACLLTPWYRVLLEKLTGLQLVKKFPAFHGTRRFITALTSVRHLSLSWASPIQSIYPHPTSWRSVLILSTHLRQGLPSGLLLSSFPSKTLYTPSPHPYAGPKRTNIMNCRFAMGHRW